MLHSRRKIVKLAQKFDYFLPKIDAVDLRQIAKEANDK